MLPGFLSQLLLLMDSGMIMKTAFDTVADGYSRLQPARQNSFTREICRIHMTAARTGENPILLLYAFSRNCGIRELSRTAGLLAENMDKGTDLWDRLEEESRMLWQEKKQMAMEQIRLSESKMSFPLGILMIALLLVTAAPAMMQLS